VESKVAIVPADIACNWSLKYYCIIGFGKAYFVEDLQEKAAILKIIMEKCSPKSSFDFPIESLEKTAIIKVKINEMTGKKSKL